ncbi:unknown [Roseburia sp. CAG:182]|nr:unknown [Roseburia sp. CAG:182]
MRFAQAKNKKNMPGICGSGNFSAKQIPDMLFCFISLL